MPEVNYKLEVEYSNIKSSWSRPVFRWRWEVTRTERYPDRYFASEKSVYGHSRFRWKAAWHAEATLKKLKNGIVRTTDVNDLTKRIDALEKELGIAR
jgi:hypothetical protein